MGNGNFKVRCIDPFKNLHYTVDEIYEIIDGKITDDRGCKMPSVSMINTFEDWTEWSSAKWELVEDSNQESKTHFKAKCIETEDGALTIGKIYEFINGYSKFDNGIKMPQFCYDGISCINDFSDLVKWFGNTFTTKWELVIENSPFDWESFKAAKFAVHCDTEEKAKSFLIECEKQGLEWRSGEKATSFSGYHRYKKDTCYSSDIDQGMSFSPMIFYKIQGIEIKEYEIKLQEVKRLAKVGEWIKIVNAKLADDCYKNGDILSVSRIKDEFGVFAKTEKTHCCTGCEEGESFIRGYEYVVLENCQPNEPVQEEPYKVDWSKVSNKEIAEELLRRYKED